MKLLHIISLLLTFFGAINWGIIGLFDFNIVKRLFSTFPAVEQIIYILIGLSALILLLTYNKYCSPVYRDHRDHHDRH